MGRYKTVIADMIKQRDALNQAISTLQMLDGGLETPNLPAAAEQRRSASDSYAGMSITSAVIAVLDSARKPLRAGQIAERLVEGGARFRTKKPKNTIAASLAKLYQGNRVAKSGRGLWTTKK
ncbi:MAG TPA: hypothetical protein VHL08_01290 [Dongiaceae bacterium]|nr:hypothetical protein [Dongiaceae bacterium]